MQDAASAPLSATFQQTGGGRTGPYKAAAFDLTPCSDLPSLDAVGDVSRAPEILDAYLFRVGADGTCLSDPNFQGLCNPPLAAATEYRWVRGPEGQAAVPSPHPELASGTGHVSQGPAVCQEHLGSLEGLLGRVSVHRAPHAAGPPLGLMLCHLEILNFQARGLHFHFAPDSSSCTLVRACHPGDCRPLDSLPSDGGRGAVVQGGESAPR